MSGQWNDKYRRKEKKKRDNLTIKKLLLLRRILLFKTLVTGLGCKSSVFSFAVFASVCYPANRVSFDLPASRVLVRLFTVLHFFVRSSRSSALRYGLPSCMSVKTT